VFSCTPSRVAIEPRGTGAGARRSEIKAQRYFEDAIMKMSQVLIAALLSGFVGLSMADDTSAHKDTMDHDKHGSISASDFVKHAGADGLAEVQMGKLASEKGSDPGVKALAEKIVTDHSKANDKLKEIASSKNLEVPTSPGVMHKTMMEKYEHQSSGKNFDQDFAKAMVKDHKNAIELFEKAASDENMDADLRAFAKKTLPTLREHLKSAQELDSKLST
jgi:putative membrane protein